MAPRPATRDELLLSHTAEYVDVVERLSAPGGESAEHALGQRYGFSSDDNPAFAGMFETEGLKVGAALAGAEGQAQVAFSIAGGMHHAWPALASGFCVFNDVAVAIHWLSRRACAMIPSGKQIRLTSRSRQARPHRALAAKSTRNEVFSSANL